MRDNIIPSTPLLFTVCRVNIVVRPPCHKQFSKLLAGARQYSPIPNWPMATLTTRSKNHHRETVAVLSTLLHAGKLLPTNNQYVTLMTINRFYNGIIREKSLTWMEWCHNSWLNCHNLAFDLAGSMEFFCTSFSNEDLVDSVSAFDFAIHIFQLTFFPFFDSCSCVHALACNHAWHSILHQIWLCVRVVILNMRPLVDRIKL